MVQEKDKEVMRSFVRKLIQNPCFAKESALTVEENIILFFTQNQKALKLTFATPSFFPALQWSEVQSLYLSSVSDEIAPMLSAEIDDILSSRINLLCVQHILSRPVPAEQLKAQAKSFMEGLLTRFEIRRKAESVFKILRNGVIDRYMEYMLANPAYVVREMRIVERLKVPGESFADYVKLVLFASPAGFVRADSDGLSIEQRLSLRDTQFANSFVKQGYLKKLYDRFKPQLSLFPEEIFAKSMAAHTNYLEDKHIPMSSRLAWVFYLLGLNFKANVRAERGAETFEKSWFYAQRRNYKYYGLDIDLIDELYRIASLRRW
jgi:hypothetical protein